MLNTILLQEQKSDGMMSLIMIVAMIAIFYFFMIRPQQRKQKKLREEREKLEKGSSVITSGGIYGKIREKRDNVVIVEIANGVKITVDKNCIYAATDPEAALQDANVNAKK